MLVTPLVPIRSRVTVTVLVITIAFVAGFWLLIPPVYLTNDDVAIRRAIEGLTAPDAAPTGYVLMAHSLLGWALAALQPLTPLHTWDVVVATLLIGSIAAVLTAAWSVSDATADRALSLAAALVAIAPLLTGLQFTITATLAGTAAMTIIAMELLLPHPRKSLLLGSGALLLPGLLVRPMSAAAGGLLTVALLIPLTIAAGERRRSLSRRFGVAAVLFGLLAFAVLYLDDALYRLSPIWNAYHDDNWMLRQLFEWGGDVPASQAEALRAQLGWSLNDWELLRRFWGIDPLIHSHARVEMLYSAWSAMVDLWQRAGWIIQRTASELTWPTFVRLFVDSRLSLLASSLVTLAWASKRGFLAVLGATTIFYVACMAIEIAFKELPARLFIPLQAGLVLAVLITSTTLGRRASTGLTTLCAAVAGVLFIGEARAVTSDALAETRQSRDTDAQVLELIQQRPSLLLLHADSFPSEYWWRPFHTPPVLLPAIQLGVNNHNPDVQRFVARSYHEPFLHAVCTHPSILVVAERSRLEPVTIYMREHYGIEVEWSEAYQASFRVWRCLPRVTK